MISIIIPTYNSEKYINETINSIINQTYQNYEVIVCDNKSSDNTIKIIKKLTVGCKNKFNFYIRSDSGVADALNCGFSNAKGDFLCWLNSDDKFFDNNVLKNTILYFKQFRDKDFLVGNFVNIDQNNKIIKPFYSFLPKKKIKLFFFYNQIFTGSLFFKKKTFQNFIKFDEKYKYAFEYDFLCFLLKNYNGIYLNKFLSYFRILPNALSSNKNDLKKEFKEILKKYNLIYSNSIIARTWFHLRNKNLLEVILDKIKY